MLVTEAVVGVHLRGVGIGVAIRRIERGHGDNVVTGVEVTGDRTRVRGARRHLPGRDLDRAYRCALLDRRRCAGGHITGQAHALVVDHITAFIGLELTIAAIKYAPRFCHHAEEAVALDTHIQRATARAEYAIAEVLVYTGNLYAHPDLRAGEDVGECHGARFKTYRLRVGDVVTNHI